METGTDTASQGEGAAALQQLIALAHHGSWLPEELPWPASLDDHPFSVADEACLMARLPEFRKLTSKQRTEIKRSELASHLSTLAYGEDRAVSLAGDTIVLCDEDKHLSRWFLGTLLADEAKHFVALQRYVERILEHRVVPHGPLREVFRQLALEKDYALNLLVGQVVLEGAAASLLASLLIATHDPLLRQLLKNVARDEARHMKFAHLAHLDADEVSPARRKRMDEILFEAAYAALASLLAEGTWEEFELSPRHARAVTVDALRDRGALSYYARVVARQLARRGFPAAALGRTLETRLEQRLRAG